MRIRVAMGAQDAIGCVVFIGALWCAGELGGWPGFFLALCALVWTSYSGARE